jgi:hypothetical protein
MNRKGNHGGVTANRKLCVFKLFFAQMYKLINNGMEPTLNRCSTVDLRNIQKREIYKQSAGDLDTSWRLGINSGDRYGGPPGSPLTPIVSSPLSSPQNVGCEDYSIYFDSLNKNNASDLTAGEIKFSVTAINNGYDIKNCVQIAISPFYFPRVTGAIGHPDFFFTRRVFAQIVELPSTQGGVFANNNIQYHFEFEVTSTSSIAVLLNPIGPIKFLQTPITTISELTLRFFVSTPISSVKSFKRIPLPPDQLAVRSVPGSNPARFTILGTNTTDGIGPLGLLPVPGVAVWINSFNSPDGAVNVATTTEDGVYVTTVVSANVVEIASLNFATIGAVNGNMVIGKNRMAIPIRFTSVKDRITNYAVLTHI